MVVAATAGVLSVAVLAAPAVADDSRRDTNTTTATATCGNGLVVLGPIVVPLAPNTTTVIQCQQPPPAAVPSW
jgi:hypothetical protein